jgi:nucleotide-binding universal stress UspA family protein
VYDDILLPIDGKTTGTEILDHASAIGRWADASIRLLYVADTTRDSVTVAEGDVVDALVQKGETMLAETEAALDDLGVACETDVVQGVPASAIVKYAERYGYDLITMPTHGREGLSRHLLGSVTEKVVRLSPVPVLTVRTRSDETLAFPYERVLVATDGSDAAKRATDHAIALADALDASVHALSAVETATLGPDVRSTVPDADAEAAANEAVGAVATAAESAGIDDVVTHVVHGTPADAIRAYVREHDVHLVVLGTTGRRGVDRILLGSVAEKTVRSTPVPVLTVGSTSGTHG